ncbi:MAG TPA: cupin domain-containing protein [Gammaproteobacteria bacterium]|nr:cupin domain-containing protein [Gammaproteobacteria bacterium]
MTTTVLQIVERLGLVPHPEGGYFREVFRSPLQVTHPGIPAGNEPDRCGGSLIYFLLEAGDFSAFHRVRWTDEIWHFYAGGAVELFTIDASGNLDQVTIHNDLAQAEPATVVPAGCWQAARLADDSPWALCGCTVAPGFEFADFEMPARAQLLERFPQHAEILHQLTRR